MCCHNEWICTLGKKCYLKIHHAPVSVVQNWSIYCLCVFCMIDYLGWYRNMCFMNTCSLHKSIIQSTFFKTTHLSCFENCLVEQVDPVTLRVYFTSSELQMISIKLTSINTTCVISSPNPMFDHWLESSRWDDSNKWSHIGFCEEII